MLDAVVDSHLPFVARLPEVSRSRAAEFLAELVTLAQSYRYYASGWITRRELEGRSMRTMRRLSTIRQWGSPLSRSTEKD
jgi:hypothetical protein